jgi:hypothetical protein
VIAFGMSLTITYDYRAHSSELDQHQNSILESRLNLIALEYGYRYRLDVYALRGLERVEFVRTLREARFVGMPLRRAGSLVKFFKICDDGTLKRHGW